MGQLSISSPIVKAVSRPASAAQDTGLLARGLELYWTWRERHRSRANLAGMSDGMLKDIGLSRGEVELEYEKPFWQR